MAPALLTQNSPGNFRWSTRAVPLAPFAARSLWLGVVDGVIHQQGRMIGPDPFADLQIPLIHHPQFVTGPKYIKHTMGASYAHIPACASCATSARRNLPEVQVGGSVGS